MIAVASPASQDPTPAGSVSENPSGTPVRASIQLEQLVHHDQSVAASLPLAEVHRVFQQTAHDFLAVVDGAQVVGVCSRATVGFMLGSRYGFSLYGHSPVWSARAPRPLIYTPDADLRRVLDETFSRSGSEFFEDIVLVRADGSLIGLIPVPSLAKLQMRLFGEQLERTTAQDEALRQQNLELFQVNHQLRQSQGRYKALFENNALGVALLETDGGIVAHNRRFEEVLALGDRPPPTQFNLRQWVAASDQILLQQLLAAHEAGAPDVTPRLTQLTFDFPGGPRLLELHTSWVGETGQICAFLEDITDQRTLEQRLARQEKQNLLDTLVAGVAHELNNKLTPVLGFSDLLLVISPEPIQGHARCIQQSAQEAAQIIRQLLSLSRPISNPHEPTDLSLVVREAVQMLRYQLREGRCEVQLALPTSPVFVHGDAVQLKQVLINLILNALHAMENLPAPRLTIALKSDGTNAWLRVTDTGSGIKPEHLNRIFDPFFTTKGPRGTGLGLSISSSLIQQHGGEIVVSSQPSQGASFTIRLPANRDASAAATTTTAEAPSVAPAGPLCSRARILIADDEEFVRQFLQEVLRHSFNCGVDTAEDGLAAVQLVEQGDYQLILSDIRMPRMDGFQFRNWLAEHRPALAERLIFVTGHAGVVEVDDALGHLPCKVIRKPFTLDAIQSACRPFLAHSET